MSVARTRQKSLSERILEAAASLLDSGGVEALSTRAVAAAAGVQQPAVYRQFGDKEGMLDAVALFVLREYLHEKRRLAGESKDPVPALRQMWDLHVEFGLENPACYQLIYCRPRPGLMNRAIRETSALLEQTIARLADQGLLTTSVERATRLFSAAMVGYVLTNIAVPPAERDPRLSAVARENAVSTITQDTDVRHIAPPGVVRRAAALREALRDNDMSPLSQSERNLLVEWLNKLADQNR